ncbi:MAG: AAA family ATPase [Nanoarchaeota archaeon]|nr:AAA family ATPase [Nanoarchaeota archaeon]
MSLNEVLKKSGSNKFSTEYLTTIESNAGIAIGRASQETVSNEPEEEFVVYRNEDGTVRLAIAAGKGGTGKTSTSSALTGEAAKAGRNVLLIDCDKKGANNYGRNKGLLERKNDKGRWERFDLDKIVNLAKTDKESAIVKFEEEAKHYITDNALEFIVKNYRKDNLTRLDLPNASMYFQARKTGKDATRYTSKLNAEDLIVTTKYDNCKLVFGITDKGQRSLTKASDIKFKNLVKTLTAKFDGDVIYDLPPGNDEVGVNIFATANTRLLVPTFSDDAASDEVLGYIEDAFIEYVNENLSLLDENIAKRVDTLKGYDNRIVESDSILTNLAKGMGFSRDEADLRIGNMLDGKIEKIDDNDLKLLEAYAAHGELKSQRDNSDRETSYLVGLDKDIIAKLKKDAKRIGVDYPHDKNALSVKKFIETYNAGSKTGQLLKHFLTDFESTTYLAFNRVPAGSEGRAKRLFNALKNEVFEEYGIGLRQAKELYINQDTEYFDDATLNDVPITELGLPYFKKAGQRVKVRNQVRNIFNTIWDEKLSDFEGFIKYNLSPFRKVVAWATQKIPGANYNLGNTRKDLARKASRIPGANYNLGNIGKDVKGLVGKIPGAKYVSNLFRRDG